MPVFKCRMCGSAIEFNEGETVGVCGGCGNKQTLPHPGCDKKAELYDHADSLRRNKEFDEAMSICGEILNEDRSDAEAYWQIVLCRYGVGCFESPATHRLVPTVDRALSTSIFDDEDYKRALEHADEAQREVYEAEAREIEELRKGVLKIAAKRRAAERFRKSLPIVIPIIAACIAFAIILTTVIIPHGKYKAAEALYNEGRYDEAIEAFTALKGKRNVSDQIEKCYIGKFGKEKYDLLNSIKPGDTYTFGAYEQDNIEENGKEPIEWIVLDKDDLKVLLISKYALDCQPYSMAYSAVTWETSYLRLWLNGPFLKEAFSSGERSLIINTLVTADKNPEYSTFPGEETTDKVFLLSIKEANEYFSTNEARNCVATDYALACGALTGDSYISRDRARFWWWLRSPGYGYDLAAVVDQEGYVSNYGYYVDGSAYDFSILGVYDITGVRPVIWIDLGS
ncbi:MAG: DUF6273 domain-containing protein [Clostridiales bacterium]|nr:DUF6273 domain-containing protein [Clostridiales bacterium]